MEGGTFENLVLLENRIYYFGILQTRIDVEENDRWIASSPSRDFYILLEPRCLHNLFKPCEVLGAIRVDVNATTRDVRCSSKNYLRLYGVNFSRYLFERLIGSSSGVFNCSVGANEKGKVLNRQELSRMLRSLPRSLCRHFPRLVPSRVLRRARVLKSLTSIFRASFVLRFLQLLPRLFTYNLGPGFSLLMGGFTPGPYVLGFSLGVRWLLTFWLFALFFFFDLLPCFENERSFSRDSPGLVWFICPPSENPSSFLYGKFWASLRQVGCPSWLRSTSLASEPQVSFDSCELVCPPLKAALAFFEGTG